MKKLVDIIVVRKEEDVSLARRREDYALKRDLQAIDNNNAISKRLLTEEVPKVKGRKESAAGKSSENPGENTE